MRWGTRFLFTGGLLLLAACTRTVVVRQPAPDRQPLGSRPPPRTPPEPDQPPPDAPPPRRDRTFEVLIPPGHLPDPGQCRVWIPGRAPGRQPRPRSRPCAGIEAIAPAGSWIVYRRADDRRLVYLRIIDDRRPGIVIRNRIFDTDSWELLGEEDPQDERRGDDRPRQERPRDDRPQPPPAQPPPVVQPPTGNRPPEPKPPESRPPEQRPPVPPMEVIRPVQPPPGEQPPQQQPPPAQPPPVQPPPDQRPPENKPPEPPPAPIGNLTFNIPPGHVPELGECRVWIPRLPPGQQPKPKSRSCDGIVSVAPAGSWIIDRPSAQPKLVYVRLIDERRAGVVIRIRVFDLDSKRLLREENP
jgi:hypothetical protein